MVDETDLAVPKQRILIGRELKFRIVWLIRLRYGAVLGVLLALVGTDHVLGAAVDYGAILAIAAALLAYNAILHLVVHEVRFRNWYTAGYTIASIQVLVDLILLAALIHQTGGLDNPLVFFYVFHGIIAAILLSRRAAYLQATAAVLILTALTAMEQTGVLAHHHVGVLMHVAGWGSSAAVLLSVAATLYLAVYMTTSLSRELFAREQRALLANERLVAQDKLKSDYVRLIAHDLKDPLAAIQSTLRVVLDGYAGEVPEKARSFVGRAESRACALAQLVRDMLDLSRMRSQADLERDSFSYVAMVCDVVEGLRPKAEENGQEIVLSLPTDPFEVRANRGTLEQVILNLVGNAIKYTPAGGKIFVSVQDLGSRFDTLVGDTGIGIPAEARARIFDEFYRAPNAKRLTRDGTGLGLALVRQIVSVYGGAVTFSSPWEPPGTAERCGTLFTVQLSWRALRPDES